MDRNLLLVVILAICFSYILFTNEVSINMNREPKKNIEINPLGRVSTLLYFYSAKASHLFFTPLGIMIIIKVSVSIYTICDVVNHFGLTLKIVDGCTYVYLDMGTNTGVQIR